MEQELINNLVQSAGNFFSNSDKTNYDNLLKVLSDAINFLQKENDKENQTIINKNSVQNKNVNDTLELILAEKISILLCKYDKSEYDQELWFNVGDILKNINSNLLEVFVKLSKLDRFKCEKFWNEPSTHHYTLNTLKYLLHGAKEKAYDKLLGNCLIAKIKHDIKTVNLNTEYFATLLQMYCGYQYCTIKINDTYEWRYYDKSKRKWFVLDKYNDEIKLPLEKIKKVFDQSVKFDHEMYDMEMTRFKRLIHQFIDWNKKNPQKIYTICEKAFCNDKFMENKNKKFLAFDNMVYDLDSQDYKQIVPEDYVIQSTGYAPMDSICNRDLFELTSILKNMFPDTTIETTMLKCAQILKGNEDNTMHILYGSANSIKFFMQLLSHAFGEYVVTFNGYNYNKYQYQNKLILFLEQSYELPTLTIIKDIIQENKLTPILNHPTLMHTEMVIDGCNKSCIQLKDTKDLPQSTHKIKYFGKIFMHMLIEIYYPKI